MNVKLREADSTDIDTLFDWVNQQDSLSIKIQNNNKIIYEDHKKWYSERLKDTNTNIWIIENINSEPIGQIRFQKKNNLYFDVDIYLIKKQRSR